MSRPRSILLVLLGAAVLFGVLWQVDSGIDVDVAVALWLSVALAAVLAAHVAAARRRRLGMLRRQFSLAVAIAVGQMLASVVVFAVLMFVSAREALVIGVVLAFNGVIAAFAARLLAAGMLRDVETIRDGLGAVGDGRRDVRIETGASDELAQLAAAANAMIERLAQEEAARDMADAARRHLVAAVSHDLRTPITTLALLAEALGDDIVAPGERVAYIDRMTTHIRALGALIDDLFELSRLEAGDIAWSVEHVELGELVAETVAAMRVQAQAKGVEVVTEVPERLAAVRANPEKVQRVLFNLIQNAIRHTPADGAVTVRAELAGEALEVEVADTGKGIEAPDRDRVFEAFYQGGEDGARSGGHAGLGLAISRAIVEAHGGRIWLADPPSENAGARVRFSLPLAR
ncbi:MAG: sensor histidine kinase [Solirubrobacteraceae bacterium]